MISLSQLTFFSFDCSWSQMNLTPFVDGINRCTYDQKYCKAEYDIVFNNLTPETMEIMAKLKRKKNRK